MKRRSSRAATAGGARSAEEVAHQIAGVRRGQQDAFEQGFGLLGRIAGTFFVQPRHHREVPPILGDFAAFQVGYFAKTGLGEAAKVLTVDWSYGTRTASALKVYPGPLT